MDIARRRVVRLRLLVVVCAILLAPTLLAFLVNLELAVRALAPGWRVLEFIVPGPIFQFFTPLAADLSAISTLVPLLLLLFPMVQGWRILSNQDADPGFINKLVFDPYPPFFSFFLAMLGLEGTLYGLFLGLGISQVAELTAATLTADAIHGTLQRLLQGTATAILSSLVGLIGAFVAARPLNWFRRLALLDEAEVVEADSLTETAHRLTGELQALAKASSAFTANLKPEMLNNMFDRLNQSARAFTEAAGNFQTMLGKLDHLAEAQNQGNALLARLLNQIEAQQQWLEIAWNRMAGGLESGRDDLRRLVVMAEQAQLARQTAMDAAKAGSSAMIEALAALLADSKAGRADLINVLLELQKAATTAAGETERERESWRQAFSAYLGRRQNMENSVGSKL